MGLFNHLFGSRKGTARELQLDAEQRRKLWQEHLDNFLKRETLARQLSPGGPSNPILNNMMKDQKKLKELLEEIRGLISEELVHIRDEEMLDEEILRDVELLLQRSGEADRWHWNLAEESRKQETSLKGFQKD